ncbi:hypothetical protein [Granulicella paludicola]|uniref:hypothetical protein n=1 Tax=Granulicella paludicola TaxID=474951 RepID=UPI0021DFEBA2|nr:hypothetical protein [Granulicella paludicola]
MKIQDEWRMYDPDDLRTHPEGILTPVAFEFESGDVIEGLYSRPTGTFSLLNQASEGLGAPVRWRYTKSLEEVRKFEKG